MKVEFGAKGKIRVTEIDVNADDKTEDTKAGKTARHGTYILTKDILAICLHDETTQASAVKPAGETSFEAGQPQAKSVCTMVLKRTDSGATEPVK